LRSGGDVDVRVADVLCVGSYPMTPERMHLVAVRAADQLADPEVSGLAVTHGTDTTEETAYFLDTSTPTRGRSW